MTTSLTPDAPTGELAGLLRPAVQRLVRVLRNQRVDMSVTLTQMSAMATLAQHGPMSAGELAAAEHVQPPSMTKVIAILEEAGLVSRESHPTDRRQAVLAITDAGRQLLDEEVQQRDRWLAAQLTTLSEAERAVLRKAVPVLDKLVVQ